MTVPGGSNSLTDGGNSFRAVTMERRKPTADSARGAQGETNGKPDRQDRLSVEGMQWNLRREGAGPRTLLLHGTGAALHSWEGLFPLLAEHHDVLALDLPGHGNTDSLPAGPPTLPGMAEAVARALDALAFEPERVVGHSAGAALALRLALDGSISPDLVVGLNAALMPFGGPMASVAQPLARLFASSRVVSRTLATRARRSGTVERLISGTGSRPSQASVDGYRAVLGRQEHVAATLSMMAHWDLRGLVEELSGLTPSLCLVVGENDRTVPPAQAAPAAARAPRARVIRLGGLGHLAHEERPRAVAEAIGEAERWAANTNADNRIDES